MPKPKTTKQVAVRVFANEERWLERESTRRKISVADLMREALEEKIQREASK